jgi:PKD-like domain/Calcineurin-like phosphoesterase
MEEYESNATDLMKFIHSIYLKIKHLRILFCMLCIFAGNVSNAQSDSEYSILVAGHAYGAHAGKNIGLHPPFLDKLRINADSKVAALFLTGDLVNNSTSASWTQVETELSGLGLTSYYVMGNHDNNTIGHAVFQKKHGGTYYSATIHNELYIILNSTESDRSISPAQLKFLDGILKNAVSSQKRIFIFFHEIIWNSHEKYRLVRSNSRSRYEFMINISNFWNQVFPMLTAYPEKNFYLIAGDVGGNPDAIAASYDRWENVTLISSGMGEVRDENYLKVDILPDTVTFKLIPLNQGVVMNPLPWYNIPEKPDQISGPSIVSSSGSPTKYEVSPLGNATAYLWTLSNGISGSSDSATINVNFNTGFQTGKISVSAFNDGFGESEPAELEVHAENSIVSEKETSSGFRIFQNKESIQFIIDSEKIQNASLKVYDPLGSTLFVSDFQLNPGQNIKEIPAGWRGAELCLIELTVGTKRLVQKIILN